MLWTFHSFILTIGEGIACILWPPALEKKDGGSGETRWSPYVFHWRGNLDACLGNDWLYLTWITPRADNTRHTRRAVVTSINNRRETYPSRRKWSEISGQEKGMLGNGGETAGNAYMLPRICVYDKRNECNQFFRLKKNIVSFVSFPLIGRYRFSSLLRNHLNIPRGRK